MSICCFLKKSVNKIKRYRKKYGFTLIELLVVISIISLLSSVILTSLNDVRMKARDTKRQQDLIQIRNALALYYDKNGKYPTNPSGNNASAGSDRSEWRNNLEQSDNHPLGVLKDQGFLSKVPIDPGKNSYTVNSSTIGCGTAQFYSYWSNGSSYLLATVQEKMGSTGCNNCGNWQGPNAGWGGLCIPNNSHGYQLVIKN